MNHCSCSLTFTAGLLGTEAPEPAAPEPTAPEPVGAADDDAPAPVELDDAAVLPLLPLLQDTTLTAVATAVATVSTLRMRCCTGFSFSFGAYLELRLVTVVARRGAMRVRLGGGGSATGDLP